MTCYFCYSKLNITNRFELLKTLVFKFETKMITVGFYVTYNDTVVLIFWGGFMHNKCFGRGDAVV